jgi:hypothetical protein
MGRLTDSGSPSEVDRRPPGPRPRGVRALPPVRLDHRAGHLGEAASEACGVLVAPFLREGRVATDVGDQERVDVCVSAGVGRGSKSIRRLAHRRRLAIRWGTHARSMDPFELEAMVDSLFVLASRIDGAPCLPTARNQARSNVPMAVWMALRHEATSHGRDRHALSMAMERR